MSARNNTPVSSVEADEAAEVARVASVNEALASELAPLFDEAKATFARARVISRYVSRGATLKEVAVLTVRKRVEAAYPVLSPAEIDEIVGNDKAVSKLGLAVSSSSIQAYATAWSTVVSAGLKPAAASVDVTFKAKSTGGTAAGLKAAVAIVAELEGEPEVRQAAYVELVRQVTLDARHAKADSVGRPSDGSDDEEPVDEIGEPVGFSLEGALHQLGVIFGQNWSEDERAQLAAKALELAGLAIDA